MIIIFFFETPNHLIFLSFLPFRVRSIKRIFNKIPIRFSPSVKIVSFRLIVPILISITFFVQLVPFSPTPIPIASIFIINNYSFAYIVY